MESLFFTLSEICQDYQHCTGREKGKSDSRILSEKM